MDRRTITASEGMIYTDGSIYGKVIHPAENVDIGKFYEISREEYERICEVDEIEQCDNDVP